MHFPTFFAYDPRDSAEVRIDKFAIFLVASACCVAGLFWTAMYYFLYGLSFTTILPLAFVVIVGSALVVAHITGKHIIAIYAQILCIIYITALIQWSSGSLFESGVVMVWAFLGPLVALMFFSLTQSIFWLVMFLLNLAITVAFNDFFASFSHGLPENLILLQFLMNLGIASVVVFVFAGYFVKSAIAEREKANRLLLNVLPGEIAPVLKDSGKTIADRYEVASVLFADIVGSTPLFSDLEPEMAVEWLHEVFTMFDGLVDKYGLEKIRTIGDNYMVAAGVPTPRVDHAQAMAALALDMVAGLEQIPSRNGRRLSFRLGINSGPVVAGVIGQSKFHYDLWGDTVNIASRMESHGEAGMVHVSEATYELLKGSFYLEARGVIPIKGKGEMRTWYLTGRI